MLIIKNCNKQAMFYFMSLRKNNFCAPFVYSFKNYCAFTMTIPEKPLSPPFVLFTYVYQFKRSVNDHKKNVIYGDEFLSESQCQNWFARCRSGNFVFKEPHPGLLTVEKVDEILQKMMGDRHFSSHDNVAKQNVDH